MPRWSSQSAYRDTIVNHWAWCMTCNVTPAGTTTHISHRSITVWPWVAVPESDRRSGSPACVSVALRNHYAYCNIIATWRLTSIQQVPTSCLMVVTLLAMFKETMGYHHHISPPFRIHIIGGTAGKTQPRTVVKYTCLLLRILWYDLQMKDDMWHTPEVTHTYGSCVFFNTMRNWASRKLSTCVLGYGVYEAEGSGWSSVHRLGNCGYSGRVLTSQHPCMWDGTHDRISRSRDMGTTLVSWAWESSRYPCREYHGSKKRSHSIQLLQVFAGWHYLYNPVSACIAL